MINNNTSGFEREQAFPSDLRPAGNRLTEGKEEMGMEFERSTHKYALDESSSKVESAEKRDSVVSLQDNNQGYKGQNKQPI